MSTIRLLVLLAVLVPGLARSAQYFVSPTGSDSNSGTSQAQAWRTIARVQQHMQQIMPGDEILFQRGGKYPGTLSIGRSGTVAQPIVVGAYGSGENPIITGGVPVTGWTQHQGNIWRASFTGNPKYLLVNNSPMTLARFPNTGWLRNVQGSTTTISAPTALNQPNGHWNGAEVVVRSTNWSYENSTISNFSNGTLTFAPILVNLQSDDWGFYIRGKLSALDMAGEWYHDASTNQLYLWAPGNADPNTLQVEACIHQHGMVPGWQREHIRIQDLVFQGQTAAGISTEVAHHVTVTGCTFRYLYKAVSSTGSNNKYLNNTMHRTFATAVSVYGEPNTVVEGNVLTDIAIDPGMGENWWGYMGLRVSGNGAVVRNNRLNNVGYIGIIAEENTLVERNVVQHATSILNDGAGIAFDHCDGLTVRDNIVTDMDCDLTSVATSHNVFYKIGFGIYFGNTSIKNTTVERNTVARCTAGIHVDHTQVSVGNRIKDNVLFDNGTQLSLSDLSNSTGPGATPPYHVPQFNDEYSGNILYSVRPEQLIMHHYNVYSPNPVDFGTFTNNRYFSPYGEINIHIFNTNSGKREYFTLEQWQASRNEDQGTTRSPLRMSKYRVDQVLTPNMISNTAFDASVNGWEGWPTEGIITRNDSLLDNGALRLNFLNNNTYNVHFLHPTNNVTLQNGEMYRYSFSIQSDVTGQTLAAVRGQSQLAGPYNMWELRIPFSTERRDVELFLESDRSEPGRVQFVTHHLDRRFWLDNVKFERVQVTELDPYEDHKLFVNEQSAQQSFALPEGCWSDVNGTVYSGSIDVPGFSSRVLYRIPAGEGCGSPTAGSVSAKVFLGGPLDPSTGLMRSDLKTLGLLPTTEPYTAMGFDLGNPGASIASGLMEATGPSALVDWVVLELRSNDAGFPLVEQRAALLRANGDVVSTTGAALVPFSNTVEGRHLVVRHRNHLAVMTAAPLLGNGLTVNMTTTGVALYGQEATRSMGAYRALWPGDVNADGIVRYAGAQNDRDEVLVAIGSVVPSNTIQGYLAEDINLDGLVKYTGTLNDRDVVLSTIGGVLPTAVRIAQVP
jgi:hypothetical protein